MKKKVSTSRKPRTTRKPRKTPTPVKCQTMKNLKAYPHKSLSEVYSTGFQFSFVSPDDEICHTWVLCKDFLSDAIWSQLNNKVASIYGFTFCPTKNPKISLDPVKLAVRNKTKSNDVFDEEINKSSKLLHAIEKRLKFTLASLEKVSDGTEHSVWLFTLDKRWVHAPPMISMLTLFLRVGCYYDGESKLNQAIKKFKEQVKHNDASYIKSSRPLRLLIMRKGIEIFNKKVEANYPSTVPVGSIHSSYGIVGAARVKVQGWDFSGLGKEKLQKVPS